MLRVYLPVVLKSRQHYVYPSSDIKNNGSQKMAQAPPLHPVLERPRDAKCLHLSFHRPYRSR